MSSTAPPATPETKKVDKITRKEYEELLQLKRQAEGFGGTSQLADVYAKARGMETDLRVLQQSIVGLKDLYNSFVKYAPVAKDLTFGFVDYVADHQLSILGAHKLLHKFRLPLPLTLILCLASIGVVGYYFSVNPDAAAALSTWANSGTGLAEIALGAGVLIGFFYWMRRR